MSKPYYYYKGLNHLLPELSAATIFILFFFHNTYGRWQQGLATSPLQSKSRVQPLPYQKPEAATSLNIDYVHVFDKDGFIKAIENW